MSGLTTVLVASVVAFATGGGAASAATMVKPNKVALKEAIVACKAEAKGKKIEWLKRRKYVSNCVVEALKERPSIDVPQMIKDHPEMRDLPVDKSDPI
jgi:hypothetical protein